MKKNYDFSQGKRGPVIPPDPNKIRITIRLDADILDYFKALVERAGGGNYQSLINQALRDHIEQGPKKLEETLRKVLREELERVS